MAKDPIFSLEMSSIVTPAPNGSRVQRIIPTYPSGPAAFVLSAISPFFFFSSKARESFYQNVYLLTKGNSMGTTNLDLSVVNIKPLGFNFRNIVS